jgi:hypothetical protein
MANVVLITPKHQGFHNHGFRANQFGQHTNTDLEGNGKQQEEWKGREHWLRARNDQLIGV